MIYFRQDVLKHDLLSCLICCMFVKLQIGYLKKGLNPPSFEDLVFNSPYFPVAVKTGIVTAGIIAMAVSFLNLFP